MLMTAAVAGCASSGGGAPTTTAAVTFPAWETTAFVVRTDDSLELCFGPPIGPGPSYIAGCPGLAIDELDAEDLEWIDLPSSSVIAARITGVLSDERTVFSVGSLEPVPGLAAYPERRTVPPTAALTDCETSPLEGWQAVADAGLTSMPIGALLGDDEASFIQAVAVDDRWMAIACEAGLRPTVIEDVFSPAN